MNLLHHHVRGAGLFLAMGLLLSGCASTEANDARARAAKGEVVLAAMSEPVRRQTDRFVVASKDESQAAWVALLVRDASLFSHPDRAVHLRDTKGFSKQLVQEQNALVLAVAQHADERTQPVVMWALTHHLANEARVRSSGEDVINGKRVATEFVSDEVRVAVRNALIKRYNDDGAYDAHAWRQLIYDDWTK